MYVEIYIDKKVSYIYPLTTDIYEFIMNQIDSCHNKILQSFHQMSGIPKCV